MTPIDPTTAQTLLTEYTADRIPDWTNVFHLAGTIRAGQWEPGRGNPIEVDPTTQRLINGQHRLIAIVLAGRTVDTNLIHRNATP